MAINLWKVSSLICGGLLVSVVAWKQIPVAHADQADQAVPYDQACDNQDEMRKALEDLRSGRHHLHLAAPNKGGHRVAGIEDATKAINQVKAGCKFADDVRDSE
jgi:hypothetical protein